MALALSASLAQSESSKQEERLELESQLLLCETSPQPSTSSNPPLVPVISESTTIHVPEVILPEASTWSKVPEQDRKRGKKKGGAAGGKTAIKTPLEVRTKEDRERQISEQVRFTWALDLVMS